MENYFVYHLHSDLSSGTTNIDSVTKYYQYIEKAKKCGMKGLCFSEHGNIFEWVHKKEKIEEAGLKYIHGIEAYVTEKVIWTEEDGSEKKVRDNYHCILIAKNLDGVKEINRLVTKSFNREDGHFYFTPRISFEELVNTSENIIITSACVGGMLAEREDGRNINIRDEFIEFAKNNKDRVFLEVQHHNTEKQIQYNKYLSKLSKETGIRLVAGTDTHCLNEDHAVARVMLQNGKKVFFEGEDGWDLTFKTYEELVSAYKKQNCLTEDEYLTAISNTNLILDMVEPFELNREFKYPKIYENSESYLREKVYKKAKEHRFIKERYEWDFIKKRLDEELDDYVAVKACDYIAIMDYLREWEHKNDIWCGPGRGSCTGSMVAYALGITEMDSIKFNLNFFRFINKYRVSMPDIDTDYTPEDRDRVKYFLLHDHMDLPKLKSAEIITFNTVALKGAIRDVGRGLNYPLETINEICKAVYKNEEKEDVIDDIWKRKYPELFKYLDIIIGTIVSVGTHPSGVLISDTDIESEIGLCTTKDSPYPCSCLNMKELDSLCYVKLDILGLDNISLINKTCKLVGIDRITPDTIDLEDWNVWKSIRSDTTAIFQYDGSLGLITLRDLFSDETISKIKKENPKISLLKLFSFGNALIRPCGASIRNDAVKGIFHRSGIEELDDLLSQELYYCIIQEDIMKFSMDFCGFDLLKADKLRKAIAKKIGTKEQIKLVEDGFYSYSKPKYNLSDDKCKEIIDPILRCIDDASRYAFSWNHSDSYSYIGYACGYLRHYYPVEFITACLNTWQDNQDKTATIKKYANNNNVKINEAKFRNSRSDYFFNKETKCIYKGMKSIKFLNKKCSDELYEFRNREYFNFIDVLYDLKDTSINSRQIDVLIKLDFFSEFGNSKELLQVYKVFEDFKDGDAKTISKKKLENDPIKLEIVKRFSKETNSTYKIINCRDLLRECEKYIKSLDLPDMSIALKAQIQKEYLGYINLSLNTNDIEIRRQLFVLETKALISKKGRNAGKTWAYVITAQSIGSGITGEYLIFENLYSKNPITENNLIYVKSLKPEVYNGRKNWYITEYNTLQ